MNGNEYRRAITGRKDAERYVLVSKEMMRQMGVAFGDTVLVDLRPDPDPDRVDFWEELVGVLEQDEEAAERFYGMTPGMQRSLNLYVSAPKHASNARLSWPTSCGRTFSPATVRKTPDFRSDFGGLVHPSSTDRPRPASTSAQRNQKGGLSRARRMDRSRARGGLRRSC